MYVMECIYVLITVLLFVILFRLFRKEKTDRKTNSQKEVSTTKLTSENSWLNPKDNFGKLEKGVVNDVEIK